MTNFNNRLIGSEHMKKLVFSSLLCLSLLGSASIAHAAEELVLDSIVAVVNDEAITESELQEEMQGMVAQLRERGTRLPPQEVLQRQILERLIMRHLQLQLAERNGIRVDDSSLNASLRNIAAQQDTSLAEMRDRMEADGFSFKSFREEIRDELILQRIQRKAIGGKVNVTEREIDNFLAVQNKQGTLGTEYRLLQILISVPDASTPEQLRDSFDKAKQVRERLDDGADFRELAIEFSEDKNALEGGDLGWLKSGEIPVQLADLLNQMSPGQLAGPLRSASGFHIFKLEGKRDGQNIVMQTRARHILIIPNELLTDEEAERRLSNLRERLLQGEDFAELAKAHSDDKASANLGGDLGWISPGVMVSEFEEKMNKLAPGDLSQPFQTKFGWHLLQVQERRQHDNTEEALRTFAAQQIRQRKLGEELQLWMRQIRDEAYVEYRQQGDS